MRGVDVRVLVTGGAGFLGSHLVEALTATGHDVVVVDNFSTGSQRNLPSGVRVINADVRSPLDDLFAAVRPAVVVHLAAQVSVPHSINDPTTDFLVNAGGTLNVMEASARTGVRKVVSISSAAVYGMPDEVPILENAPTYALSPYGLSKLTAEHYVRLIGSLRGVAYTILRPANIYGPRQVSEGEGAVVPAFLTRFLSGRDPIIHGNGSQTRDFIYVRDMAKAIIQALQYGDGLTLNIGSGMACTIMDLWKVLARRVGWTRPPVLGPNRCGDILQSVLSSEAARKHLRWEPTVSLDTGISETVDYWERRFGTVHTEVAKARTSAL